PQLARRIDRIADRSPTPDQGRAEGGQASQEEDGRAGRWCADRDASDHAHQGDVAGNERRPAGAPSILQRTTMRVEDLAPTAPGRAGSVRAPGPSAGTRVAKRRRMRSNVRALLLVLAPALAASTVTASSHAQQAGPPPVVDPVRPRPVPAVPPLSDVEPFGEPPPTPSPPLRKKGL